MVGVTQLTDFCFNMQKFITNGIARAKYLALLWISDFHLICRVVSDYLLTIIGKQFILLIISGHH